MRAAHTPDATQRVSGCVAEPGSFGARRLRRPEERLDRHAMIGLYSHCPVPREGRARSSRSRDGCDGREAAFESRHMKSAPDDDSASRGRRRCGTSRRGRPAPDGAGPAAAIAAVGNGGSGRGGGKREPGKRWKPGAFTGGPTRITRHSHRARSAGDSGAAVVTITRVLSFFAHEAADAIGRPAFRAPSARGRRREPKPGRGDHAAGSRSCIPLNAAI